MKGLRKSSIVLDLENLYELYGQNKNNHIGDAINIFPFIASQKNPKIYRNFSYIYGEFSRHISRIKVSNYKNDSELATSLVTRIMKQIEFDNDSNLSFKDFFNSYFFTGNKIRPTHPFLYNFLGIGKDKDVKKFGKFLFDILLTPNSQLQEVFNLRDPQDVLHELILSNIEFVYEDEIGNSEEYQNLLPIIGELYRSDLAFLIKHESYFLEKFPLLTNFYMFMYVSQLVLKFDQYHKGDFTKLDLLNFGLDWESLSRRREAAAGPGSYQHIKERLKYLFPHVHALSHLSHNNLKRKDSNKNEIFTYSALYNKVKNMSEHNQQMFINSLKDWINTYSQLGLVKGTVRVDLDNVTLENAFWTLHEAVKQGMSKDSMDRYGANLEHMAKENFIKARGNLGFVFNITSDFLLLLTAVSVKEKRIPLNKLFQEFGKRGINLDYKSKKEVVVFLENLNYLDKKSDSGDAQYVKPIL